MSYIGRGLQSGAFRQLDDISSGFDGSDTTHTMQVNSTNVTVGDVNQILLSLGGVIQKPGTDFTVSGSTLTFTTAPAANTNFFAILLGSDNGGTVTPTDGSVTPVKLNLNDTVTITTDDNTDTLIVQSTDADASAGPVFVLDRASGSPADNDLVGRIIFRSRNDAGENHDLVKTNVFLTDASDGSEGVTFEIDQRIAGTYRNFLSMTPSEIVLNDDSQDLDFRVESNANPYQLYVDGGVPFVGISSIDSAVSQSVNGGDIPALQIKGTTSGTSSALLSRHANDANGPILFLYKSRNATPGSNTIVQDDDQIGQITFMADDGTDGNSQVARIRADIDASPGANDTPGRLVFMVTADSAQSATERMRIDRNGKVLIGSTADATSSNIQVITPDNNARVGFFQSTHSSNPFGILIDFDQAAPNNGVQSFLDGIDSSASRFSITSNGAIYGNGTFGTLSDERIKKDIVDANSQWDDIKAIKVRNFKKKVDGDSAIVEIGVVAQELEAVSPKLISELQPSKGEIRVNSEFGTLWTTDDAETKDGVDAVLYTAEDADVINGKNVEGGIKVPATHSKKVGDVKEVKEKVKGVKYSVLQIKALKALQEAMARIETLEADVKTLKGE